MLWKLQKHKTALVGYCVLACLVVGSSVSALDYPTTKKTGNPVTSKSQQMGVLRVDKYRYGSLSTSGENKKIVDNKNDDQEIVRTSQIQDIQGEESEESKNMNPDGSINNNNLVIGGKATTATTTVGSGVSSSIQLLQKRLWDRLDAMDKMIVSSTLPLAALTSVIPLMQAADLFWVNQLGDTIAVSAQSAANMVYQFSFGMFSFLPAVTATLVSKNYANNDLDRTQAIVCRALVFALMFSSTISMILFTNTGRCLGAVLKGNILSALYIYIYIYIHISDGLDEDNTIPLL
jgi:hypothetical protein